MKEAVVLTPPLNGSTRSRYFPKALTLLMINQEISSVGFMAQRTWKRSQILGNYMEVDGMRNNDSAEKRKVKKALERAGFGGWSEESVRTRKILDIICVRKPFIQRKGG